MKNKELSLKRSMAGKLGHEVRMKKYGKEYYSALGKRSQAIKKAKREGREYIEATIPLPKEKKGFIPTISSFLSGKS